MTEENDLIRMLAYSHATKIDALLALGKKKQDSLTAIEYLHPSQTR